MREEPEKHGESVDADHVVGVTVGEEELVGGYNPPLTLYTVKPEYLIRSRWIFITCSEIQLFCIDERLAENKDGGARCYLQSPFLYSI